MITDEELQISNQSYLHKDFYQLYPEILDLVNQITERWDPASSNESDPGVVILKLLAFMGDKINYNIDKNILECFMPSATQEDSMRKLCDMMGYDMHYYRSASTPVSFMWVGEELPPLSAGSSAKQIVIPRFSTISNSAKDDVAKKINYVLTEDVVLNYRGEIGTKLAIEGTLVPFLVNNTDSDNPGIVRLSNLDDNNRLYFPEPKVAENGVFIDNASASSARWDRVTNLNLHISTDEVHYWKFCFDSKRKLPYIQFPDNIADIIGEGLIIRYVRTSGADGNVAAKTLTTLTSKTTVTYQDSTQTTSEELPISDGDNTYLVIQNASYTQTGMDIETIDDAYIGFKKTIGTFDTLVTCRDYANAIYNMVVSDVDVFNDIVSNDFNTANYVSNVQVADIRDDINFTTKIATFDDFGIAYFDNPTTTNLVPDIDHFDIFIYPLNAVRSLYVADNYKQAFKPNIKNFTDIKRGLEDYQTVSHSIKQISSLPSDEGTKNIFAIKNYYHLTATVSTTSKVTKAEGNQILNNIYVALYKEFNPRKLDYGEELNYNLILKTMQNADPRIKFIALDDPKLTAKVMNGDGEEYTLNSTDSAAHTTYKNHLLAKNILAGRLPLFNYDTRFDFSFGQTNVSSSSKIYGAVRNYPNTLTPASVEDCSITAISTNLRIPKSRLTAYKLKENESIQLKAKNISTEATLVVGINYYLQRLDGVTTPIPAKMDYRLAEGEALYVNYTDSDDVEHFIKYTRDSRQESNVSKPWSGIIRANFDLYDSGYQQSAASGSISQSGIAKAFPGTDITTMMSLKGTDSIELRNFVKTKLTSAPFYCYWSTNADNNLVFTKNSANKYEYTLDDNEYFFYTDALKNVLVTLGPGTTLTLTSSITTEDEISWTLNKSSDLDVDDIASKGIGAFADTEWYQKNFSENDYLEIEENQLILLGKDDIVSLSGTTSADQQEINNEWLDLTSAEASGFLYNGKSLPAFSPDLGIAWAIRSVLNLNIGPSLTLELKHESNVAQDQQIIKEIDLYTSVWFENPSDTTPITVTDDTDLSKCYEKILLDDNYKVAHFSNESETECLRANYLMQQNGSPLISMHRYSYDGVLKDDLLIYPLLEVGCSKTWTTGSTDSLVINTFANNFTKVELRGTSTITLPVYIPENEFGVFMLYHKKLSDTEPDILVSTAGGESVLSIYKDNWDGGSASSSLPLGDGVTVLRIDGGCVLNITIPSSLAESSTAGSLVFSDVSIVHGENYGINIELFDIRLEDIPGLLNRIRLLDENNQFVYNIPINNNKQIDVSVMDEYSWFNHNNVCNKFVIAQIDTDFSDIQIAKSSRLGKW